jgi:protein-disulfide isomerase
MTAILLVAAATVVPALAKKDKKAEAPATTSASASMDAAASDASPAAIVGGETITMGDLDRAAANQLTKIRQQEYDTRKNVLQQLINEKLIAQEAAARNVSSEELVKQEVDAKAPAATDAEAQQYYDRMKGRMAGKTFEEVKGELVKNLTMQKQVERRTQFTNELAAKANVKTLLDPPRSTITVQKEIPSIGPADAPIQIVEWSDYQCPFCKRAHPTVEQVLTEYKDKVRFTYVDYPLSFHKQAWPASVAVHCASDQNKYWEYHKNLMEVQGDLSAADLNKRATDLGLDAAAFGTCLDSKKFDTRIQTSFNDGASLGVTGTPAFFINGRMLVGAQPIEAFRDVINDELTRKGIAKPASVASTSAPAGTK